MKMAICMLVAGSVAIHAGARAEESTKTVVESARDIPVAYDVDVAVVGGTTGAVTAAVEAAEQGADVFLAAPRPYLGEDICATYRLWLDPGEEPATPLAKALFAEPEPVTTVGESLPFTYTASIPSADRHKDTPLPSRLADGRADDAFKDSIEYGGDVTIVADLGEAKSVGKVHVFAFQRPRDIELETITVWLSSDGETWNEAGKVNNSLLGQGEYINSPFVLSAQVTGTARYVKILAEKSARVERVLLGEIVIEPEGAQEQAPGHRRVPPMPMQVKRGLDEALNKAGVQFLYGCFATDLILDADGRPAGIVMANRNGRQAVRAKVIIDATPRATVARLAGAECAPYPAGEHTFTRVVVGGDPDAVTGLTGKAMPSLVQIDQGSQSTDTLQQAMAYSIPIPMNDDSWPSLARAEQIARDQTWTPRQIAASEVLFELPPNPVKGQASVSGRWPGAAKAELAAFRPAGVERLYVLGPCADVSREAAGQLLRPLAYMDLGTRIGAAAAQEADMKPKPVIVCFGDSITASTYPERLEALLDGYKVVNAGVGGNTTGQGLARIEQDVLSHNPAAVAVLFGTNDSVMNQAKTFRTPLAQYEANLRNIAERCTKAGAKVVLATLPPIVAEPYYERHPKEYYDAEGGLPSIVKNYAAAARSVANDLALPLVDLNTELAKDLAAINPDGVHPSRLGQERIAELAASALRGALAIPEETAPEIGSLRVPGTPADGSVPGEIREVLVGVRPFQQGLPTIHSEAKALPVLGEYDVVVVGGGTGGAPAGIGAARDGAKTLVVEFLHGLGGVSTLGLIGRYYYGNRIGFTEEIDLGVEELGGSRDQRRGWDVEAKMEWYRRELRKAGADIWFGALGCGTVVDGDKVKGIVVATSEGRGVVLADVVIDATGNSDVAYAAGAECVFTDASSVAVQGTGLPPRKPGAFYTNTDYTFVDDADLVDRWRAFVAARTKYQSAYDLGQIIDTRERRRIVGDFVISPLDIFNGRTYPDSVVYSYSNFDTHGYTIHPLFALKTPDKKSVMAYTPYRSMLPKDLDGILCIGLGISAHRDAMPILRMQPDIQNGGFAAGIAASTVARKGIPTRELDVKTLQKALVAKGNLPETVLTDQDSYPVPIAVVEKAVATVANDYEGIGPILAEPDKALPLLRQAYRDAEVEPDKVIYAHILGMFGDDTGADTLAAKIASQDWDEGWAFTGMGQFGASVSPLDSLIIALGRTGSPKALQPILEKVKTLGPEHRFSHHRAVSVALESLGQKEGAAPLAEVLRKPGMRGYAATSMADANENARVADPNLTREHSLRELLLARALYRCGDQDGLGEAILRQYAQDLRGHHARHANAILNEKK